MAVSRTDIANAALGRVGAKPIMDLDDPDSLTARICKLVFDPTIEEVGRSAEWNCLKDRADLAQLSETPAFGWAYQYQLPTGCLKLVKLNGTASDADPSDEYEIEGKKILTDAETAKIQYIKFTTDTNQYDSLFIDAVVVLLAAKIAIPIRGGGFAEMTAALKSEYEQVALPKARKRDAAERKRVRYNPASESRFIRARRFSTNG
jgi:hypothetical protein